MGLLLSLLLVISGLLRGSFVTTVPPELFGDEVDVGYQAYSLLQTGRDLYNQVLPIYVHSLSEWRAPLIMYATVPTIAAFGNTELGVRLPEVVFGTLTPLLLFFLVYHETRSRNLAIFSSFFLCFLPWHIFYSRAAYESVFLIDFLLLGTLLFLRKNYFFSALFFALTIYTYSTAVVFTPLWLAGLSLLTRRRPHLVFVAAFLLLVAPFALTLLAGHSQDRFNHISVFSETTIVDQVNLLRRDEPSRISVLFNNKYQAYARVIMYNYFRAFSTDFLFINGDPVVRQSIQVIGQLLPLTAPFLVLGLIVFALEKRWFWFVWLFLAPLPSSFTQDGGFHATRLFLMIPPLVVFLGAGFAALVRYKKILFITLLPVLFEFIWVSHYYLVNYPKSSWRWWSVGFKAILTDLPTTYDHVFINNTYEPSLIRFLFYTRYSPAKFHAEFTGDQPQKNLYPQYDGFSLTDKYIFGSFTDQAHNQGLTRYLLPGSLYIISQRDDLPGDWDWRTSPPAGVKVISTSTNAYNQPVLYQVIRQ